MVPAVVETVLPTPVAVFETPVRSNHWDPSCAGKLYPDWVKVPLVTATLPLAPTTLHPGMVFWPVLTNP